MKVAGHLREGCQEEVAKAVSMEPLAVRETIPEQPRKQSFVLGQRDHAVADVARRQHVERSPQLPGAAAVIAYRNDGSQFDEWVGGGLPLPGGYVTLEPLQQR